MICKSNEILMLCVCQYVIFCDERTGQQRIIPFLDFALIMKSSPDTVTIPIA